MQKKYASTHKTYLQNMKTLELHYPMIQFLVIVVISQGEDLFSVIAACVGIITQFNLVIMFFFFLPLLGEGSPFV